uniref:Uncharacterized protein n=1 Tax=Lactuca sativa TaxID=4236 RepID=A0A9R1VHM3_LACSA|nr:hypothetical protein LSAT_V11C500234690 [Lactuca sativa]
MKHAFREGETKSPKILKARLIPFFYIFHLLDRLSSLGSSLCSPIRFSATPDLLLIGLESTLILTSIAASNSKSSQLTSSRAFAAKKAKSSGAKAGNKKAQPKSKVDEEAVGSSIDDATHDVISDERNWRRLLDEDEHETGGGAAFAIC